MKKLILSALLAGASVAGFAQSDEKISVGISAGMATPTGAFAEKEVRKGNSGLAETGSYFSIDGSYFLNDFIGVGATFARRNNALDEEEYKRQFNQQADIANSIETTNWRSTFTMVNVIARLPVSDNFGVYAKAMTGLSFNTTPEFDIDTDFGRYTQDEVKSTALAYGFGVGAKYYLGPVALGLEVNLLNTEPELEVTNPSGQKGTFDQPMNSINTAVTLSYILVK